MKKILLRGFFIVMTIAWSTPAWSNPPCPQSTEELQAFAGCMVQFRGGTVLRAPAGGTMDADHRLLLMAMSGPTMPPQTLPTSAYAVVATSVATTAAVVYAGRYPFIPYPYIYPYYGFGY